MKLHHMHSFLLGMQRQALCLDHADKILATATYSIYHYLHTSIYENCKRIHRLIQNEFPILIRRD